MLCPVVGDRLEAEAGSRDACRAACQPLLQPLSLGCQEAQAQVIPALGIADEEETVEAPALRLGRQERWQGRDQEILETFRKEQVEAEPSHGQTSIISSVTRAGAGRMGDKERNAPAGNAAISRWKAWALSGLRRSRKRGL